VANFLGDAVLVVFGLPTSHEDDPERAICAGLAIRDAVPRLNDTLAADLEIRLQVRIGINTGEVVAASGSTFDRDFLISDAVTTAARIQQTIAPGSLAVGERTYRLTRTAIEYRDLAPLAVKGKTEPLRVWEAVARAVDRGEAAAAGAPLVGRQRETALLHQFYERTCADSAPHLVTIVGQPGVGKSRVLREFLTSLRATSPNLLVLRGRSVAFGGQIGYPALLDILKAQAGLLDTDPPEAVRRKLAHWLEAVQPGQDHLLESLLFTFGPPDGNGGNPEQARRALFDGWRTLLAGLAMTQPVVAVFEDVHWADDGVLDLIQSMLRAPDATPLLMVCLGRQELLERHPRWGGRNAITLELQPLKRGDIEALVGALAHDRLTAEMQRTIVQRAEGNPLFAEELVRMLTERPEASRAPGSPIMVPDSVQAVLAARIDRLPQEQRRVLQAASVIGRTFWPSAIAQLAGLVPDAVARALDGLESRDFVVERPQSTIAAEREYAFRQILTRDVAYGMLPRSQRQRAHGEAAGWLESRLGDRAEEVVQILAEHFRMAGDDPQAAVYLRRAANRARRLYANADAIRLFEQALESAKKAGVDSEIPHLYLERGEVHQLLGAYTEALADFEAGLAGARRAGDRHLEAELENHVGFIYHRTTRFDDAEAHFRQAAALAREVGNPKTLGRALVDLATLSWDRGEMATADALIAESVGHLRETGDLAGLARALNLRCMVNLALGHGPESVAAAEEALAVAREAGDRSREATSLSYLSVVHNWMGQPAVGLKYGHAAAAVAEEIGDRRRVTYARQFIAQAYHDTGEWGKGIALSLELLPDTADVTPLEVPFLYAFLGHMYAEIGDSERAREALRRAGSFETPNPGWVKFILVARLALARLERDAPATNDVLDQITAIRAWTFAPTDGYAVLPVAEALVATGRWDNLRALLANERTKIVALDSPAYLAGFTVAEALLAIHEGRLADAAPVLDRAVEQAESSGNVLITRRAREIRLEHLHRDEDREELRRLHTRIADGLPDDLRAIFLSSPRVTAQSAPPY
jgi:tetratricopeptide (TPR) repeat protein